MATPTTRTPTKKTFHFPKTDESAAIEKTSKPDASKPAGKKTVSASAEKSIPAKPVKAAVKKAVKPVTKGAVKPVTRSATQPATQPVTKPVVNAASGQEEKPRRAKKEKVVRDSFTMPKSDYSRLASLKQKCLAAGIHIKKSELLRAGLMMLEAASEKNLLAAVKSVETIKTGRPAKN
jgi:hypothetical protein